MNRDEILAMKPGRELDALVAEKVMGLKIPNRHNARFYSTDISDAWEVVEKMKEKNWWSVISSESDKWNACFYWDPNQEAFEAEARATPEAICKAALLAVLEASHE